MATQGTAISSPSFKTNKGKNTSPTVSTFKSFFPSGYKVPSLRTNAVTKLKGQKNYEEWSAHIDMMIEAIGAYGIVYKG